MALPGSQYVPIADSELKLDPGTHPMGGIDLNQIVEVAVCVRPPSSGADLEKFVESQSRQPAWSRKSLSRTELLQTYGADAEDLDAVGRFANDNGLSISAIDPDLRTINLTGTLKNLAQAFHINFVSLRGPDRSIYRGFTGSVQVPGPIANIVKAVVGLDTRPPARAGIRRQASRGPAARPAGASAAPTPSYTPPQVAAIYDFPTDLDGTGQCVGIIEFGGGYNNSDLNTYFQGLGITTPRISPVSVAGAANLPLPGNSTDEVMMDIEIAGSIAPGAQFVVYFAPNTTKGWYEAFKCALHDSYYNPSVFSVSWGGAEWSWGTGGIYLMNLLLASSVALGKTIVAAAGDDGCTDGASLPGSYANVNFPASSPYVLGCGGTHLDASGDTRVTESVWNDASGATGGGVSAYFSVPSYQQDANVPPSVNPPNKAGRGVPDVAADADPYSGYIIRVGGVTQGGNGGTSAAAPLWAALLTLINQNRSSPLGWVNPLLYQDDVASGGFNSILVGNNGPGGYNAGPGWNACTGLGTPNGTALLGLLGSS